MNLRAGLLDHLQRIGLEPHNSAEVDWRPGECQRFRVAGDKAGSKNGAVRCWGGDMPGAIAWTFKDADHKHVWRPIDERRPVSSRERLDRARRNAERRRDLAADREAEQARVRVKAGELWGRGRPVEGSHPYLVRKGVRPYGLRQLGRALMVPLYDRHGVLQSLQFIDAEGGKRFLTGGLTAGCYCPIGRDTSRIMIVEGWATAASVHEAMGCATAAAMNANNLGRVACALRSKFPHAEITICADDDAGTPGNPGLTAAMAAARQVGGRVAVPELNRSGAA